MKDLDNSTLQLVRHLDNNHARFKSKFRSMLMVVVWVDGEEKEMTDWARKHGIKNIPLAVISRDDPTLDPWNINPKMHSTTVLTMPCLPKQVFTNFNPMHHVDLEAAMNQHFARYRTAE